MRVKAIRRLEIDEAQVVVDSFMDAMQERDQLAKDLGVKREMMAAKAALAAKVVESPHSSMSMSLPPRNAAGVYTINLYPRVALGPDELFRAINHFGFQRVSRGAIFARESSLPPLISRLVTLHLNQFLSYSKFSRSSQ